MQKKPAPQPQNQHNSSSSSNWQNSLKKEEQKQMLKKAGIWGGIILACLIGMVILVKVAGNTGPETTPVENANLKPVSASDIVVGNPNAKITITEYADFQCPACATYNPTINRLLQEFDGQVKLVYRFFPLRGIHKNAVISGRAAYAANKQGKFSEMKDMLFEKQKDWENLDEKEVKVTFILYAQQIGIDQAKFQNDMNSKEAEAAVLSGEKDAMSLGLNSTPSFFIGKKQISPQGFESFKEQIQKELNITKPLQ